MSLESKLNEKGFLSKLRNSIVIKAISYGLAAGLALGIGYGLNGCKDKGVKEVSKSRKETEKKQLTVFKNAEEYHIKGEFDDAKNWYSMVIRDFPDSKEAAESSFRRLAIEISEIIILAEDSKKELGKALEYLNEAEEYYSDFKYDVREKGVLHIERSKEIHSSIVKIVEEQFLDDFLNLKGYLKGDINAWRIPDIPIDKDELIQLQEEQLSKERYKGVTNKFRYNMIVDETSRGDKIDRLNVIYLGGYILYNYSEKTTEFGKKELEGIIEETEDDSYNETRYMAKEELGKKQIFWKTFSGVHNKIKSLNR